MKIDLNCPVELVSALTPRPDHPACDLMIGNLSDETVTSIEVTLLLLDEAGEEKERVVYRAHDLDGRPGTAFAMIVPAGAAEASGMEITFEKVWFYNNSVWRRSKEPLTEYTPNTLEPGR